MSYVFLILFAALLLKDSAPLGDRFLLRGGSELVALGVGATWLFGHQFRKLAKRYAIVFSYLGVLLLTVFVSQRPLIVLLQVLSLASVVLFFVAYVESTSFDRNIFDWNIRCITIGFALVCTGSLVLLVIWPSLAFEVTQEGNRFKGLFSEPAMMGAVSGLLLGIAAFGKMNWFIRLVGSLAAIPCLYLTGSRTSWGAAIAGLAITFIIYIKKKGAWVIVLVCLSAVASIGLILFDIHVQRETQSRVIRSGSLGTLSGRTVLWELALEKYKDSPILGYGFTTGSDALASDMGDALNTAFGVADRSKQKSFSLHSGYIQSLLDSGTIGATLYVSILWCALWRFYRHDRERRHGAEMYGLIFFSLSNVADTIIFGAAVFYEVFYWYLSVLALGLLAVVEREPVESSVLGHTGVSASSALAPYPAAENVGGPGRTKSRLYPILQE